MASQRKRPAARGPVPAAPQQPPQPPKPPHKHLRPHLLIALALCLLTLLAYSNSFTGGYTLDCNQLLRLDQRIQHATAANVDLILHHTYWWPAGESGLYRPLSTLSYMFNYAVLGNGERSAGYHCVNLLLHLCNVLLLYALCLRLMGTRGRAFAVAALWAVHPVLTESVTNMVGRPDLLAGIGVLGGFLLYLLGVEATGRRRWAAFGGAAAATAIGVFSKESGVTVLGVIAIYELAWWRERRQVRGRLAGLIAVAIPVAAMLYQRVQVMAAASAPASFPFVDNPLVDAGFLQGRLTAIAILARYLWRLVCPITLSADYSYAQIPLASGTLADWAAWLVVAAVAVLVFKAYRWNRTAFFFAGFAAVSVLPMCNLLFPIGTIMAERFLYLPAAAFSACLVLCYGAIPPRFRAAAPWFVGLLVTAYIVRTWLRNPDWRDDLRMAQAMLKTSPNSFKVRKMLANNLFHADASHSRMDEAITQAEIGLAMLDPLPNSENNAESYSAAGGYYIARGDLLRRPGANGNLFSPPGSIQAFQRAIQLFNRAIAILGWPGGDPRAEAAAVLPNGDVGKSYRALSQIYLRLDNAPMAYGAAMQALVADPLSPNTYLQLSSALDRSNRIEEAAVALLEGNTLVPDKRFTNELLPLFKRGIDPRSCALKQVGQGYTLDPGCEAVRRLLCPALSDAIAVRMRTGRPDLARQLRDGQLRQYGCPASSPGLLGR